MICRVDITGQKIWIDNNNEYKTRPASTDINLFRDNQKIKTVTLDSASDGVFKFLCQIFGNSQQNYKYTVDEVDVPPGYKKTIEGFNIINTLEIFEIKGTKTWRDSSAQDRPASIKITLLQNNVPVDSIDVATPAAGDTAEFTFGEAPFADDQGKPFVYTITEDPVANYNTIINGFNIINSHKVTTP